MTSRSPQSSFAQWLDATPDRWHVARPKTLFTERRQSCTDADVHLTPSQTYGVLPQAEFMRITGNRVVLNLEGADSMKHVEPDDFVIHLRSFQGGIEYSGLAGKVSVAYTVLTPRPGADPGFFRWALKSQGYIQSLQATVNQLRDGQSIKYGDFDKVPLPLPPADEQRAIADFLDEQTSRIDALIDKQTQLITTLRERRDACWSRAYAEAANAGEIPLRRVIDSIADGPFGSSLTSAHYVDAGTRVIRLGNIGVNEFKDEDAAFIADEHAATLESHRARQGDVVVAGLGDDRMPLGRAALVPDIGPAIVKADCYRLRPSPAVSGAFLAWALSAPQVRAQMQLLARGSTRQRLNTTVVRDVLVPQADAAAQRRALARFGADASRVDTLIQKTQQHIALAQERRAALITAAVTGQIDVRTAGRAKQGAA